MFQSLQMFVNARSGSSVYLCIVLSSLFFSSEASLWLLLICGGFGVCLVFPLPPPPPPFLKTVKSWFENKVA